MDARYTTGLDIEECLGSEEDDHVHIFVADVVNSFNTMDRDMLDCVLSRLGLPGWFLHVYFELHADVRLRLKFATGIGEAWPKDGGTPQGYPLSVVFILTVYLPWKLSVVKCQLYVGNLKRVIRNSDALLDGARISNTSLLSGKLLLPPNVIFEVHVLPSYAL